jgi:hypothetical protein
MSMKLLAVDFDENTLSLCVVYDGNIASTLQEKMPQDGPLALPEWFTRKSRR